MSVDRRLREGLRASADALRPHVPGALAAVEGAARRHRRRMTATRAVLAVVAVVVVLAVPFALIHARQPGNTPLGSPGPLVGTYVVDVADSDLARSTGMTGRWIVELRPDGSAALTPPSSFTSEASGVSYQLQGDQLRTDAFVTGLCQTSVATQPLGVYRWQRSGTTMRLTVISDDCDARRLLFAGQKWEAIS